MAPAGLIDLSVRPTKIDRASDVRGPRRYRSAREPAGRRTTRSRCWRSVQRISARKIQRVDPKQPWPDPKQAPVTRDEVIRELVSCGYVKAADVVDRFGDPSSLDPELDPDIVGSAGIFTQAEYDSRRRVPQDGGCDEDGDLRLRRRGHDRDGRLRLSRSGPLHRRSARLPRRALHGRLPRVRGAARCAADAVRVLRRFAVRGRAGGQHRRRPRQVHVDAATTSRRRPRSSWSTTRTGGRRCSVRVPGGAARHQQIGYFRPDASVETASSPAANNVNLLVETVVLNYMALHGEQGQFGTQFPGSRSRFGGAAGQPDRIQPDRQRHDRLGSAAARRRNDGDCNWRRGGAW